MSEYEFSLTRIFPYKDRIYTGQNTGQRKLVLWHFSRSERLMDNNSNWINRTSRPEVFCKKGILENVTNFTGKHLCQSLFFNKVTGLSILPGIIRKPLVFWWFQRQQKGLPLYLKRDSDTDVFLWILWNF